MVETILTSKWANRFIWAAIIQGGIAFVITMLIVLPFLTPSPSRVIASGSAGTWFFVGYISYIIVGVIAVAVTALFYQHLEVHLRRTYSGFRNVLAWLHFILMNVGAAGATWLLMVAGYIGGTALLPTAVGGGGLSPGEVHQLIGGYVEPIGYFIILGGLGVLLGGIGYIIGYIQKP